PGHVVSDYLGRLYGYRTLHRPIGNGLQPLDEILKKRTGADLFAHYGRFSLLLYRDGLRPGALPSLRPSFKLSKTRIRYVAGLSTHYIPIRPPAGAKAVAVAVVAGGGPLPHVILVAGGPHGRIVHSRSAKRSGAEIV